MDLLHLLHLEPQEGRALREDEYIRQSDGMICCKSCHTPRERFLQILDQTYRPRMMCRCQSEAYDKEQEEDRHRRFLEQISRNRSVGLPDPEHRKHTFANDLGYNPIQMKAAKNYVENWEDLSREGTGLLLWGGVGTGKSFLAGCIANGLLDKGVRVLMTNFSRLLNNLSDLRFSERNNFINSLSDYPLLIIDDLGIERNSDYAKEQVFSVIDSRYRSGKPMIITTNLSLREMSGSRDVTKSRIYNRILERCTPLEVSNLNIRNHNAISNHQKVTDILRRGA